MMFTALVTPRWMSCKVVAGKPMRSLLLRTSLWAEWQRSTQPLGQQDDSTHHPDTATLTSNVLLEEQSVLENPVGDSRSKRVRVAYTPHGH